MTPFTIAGRICAAGLLLLSAAVADAQSSEDAAVRRARGAFNDAIARRDLVAMKAVLSPRYHVVVGRSAQSHGPDAMVERFRSTFAGDSLYGCVRTPETVDVNVRWELAHERGSWRCRYSGYPKGAKPGHATGIYDAKWQRDSSGTWRLQVEVFTTLECQSQASACNRPDPVPAAASPAGPPSLPKAADAQVLALRAFYNRAIARGDAAALTGLFVPEYHAVFGRGRHIEADTGAMRDWREDFASPGRSACVRSPSSVVVNESWGLAHERGSWRCPAGNGAGGPTPSGAYVAKWQRDTAGRWRIQTEVFTTLRCTGPATGMCDGPEPLAGPVAH